MVNQVIWLDGSVQNAIAKRCDLNNIRYMFFYRKKRRKKRRNKINVKHIPSRIIESLKENMFNVEINEIKVY